MRLPSGTVALADKLRAEGLPNVRRWRYLLVGAPTRTAPRHSPSACARSFREDTVITVEESAAAVDASRPFNPFALLGGLGG